MAYRDKEFGERLEKLIKENDFSNEKVAGDVDLSASTIGKYINDGRVPVESILNKIADVLGVTAQELRYGKKTSEAIVTGVREVMAPYDEAPADWNALLNSFNRKQWSLAGKPERRILNKHRKPERRKTQHA